MKRLSGRPWLAGWLVASFATIAAAEQAPVGVPLFVAPLPAVVAFAAAQKIPLEKIDLAAARVNEPAPGDSVTALVTLDESGRQRQWLIQLTAVKLSPTEQRDIERAKSKLTIEMFTSIGTDVRINSAPYPIEARTIGPFSSEQPATAASSHKPPEKRARALVIGGFLGLGLDRFCTAAPVLRHTTDQVDGAAQKLDWRAALKPFPDDVVAKNRPLAAAAGITPEDERSVFAGPLALRAFFNVAQKTPGLQEILLELLDKSSLAWSMLTHNGELKPDFVPDFAKIGAPFDSKWWGPDLPPACRCPLLILLNEKPSLETELIVTTPRPPLLNCGGVLGLVVAPVGNKTKQLTIRVLAGRRGESAGAP
ncbi:MAG TPA: hypothetical protein VHD62_07990 [Opitutaceae bacterium]|nr:hypothetical protein [Opitutaceae bacterium]